LSQTDAAPSRTPSFGQLAGLIHAGWRAVVRSLLPPPDQAWLTDAQLELYRSGTRHTALIMPVAAFFVSEAVSPWVASGPRTAWWAAVSFVSVAAELIGNRLDRVLDHGARCVRLRACWFTAINAVFFLAWCSMSVVLWAPHSPADHMMLVLILACSLAGTIAVTAMHPGIAFTAFVIHTLFIIGPTASSGRALDQTLAGLATIYAVLLAGQFVALNQSMAKMLRLEHEKSALVENLRAAKQDSDRERGRALAANQAKSQFLSNMNHELRTPMNAILGFSEMIKQRSFGDAVEKYAEYGDIIHESGRHLLALINDMLDLAKIEGGRYSLRETEVDLLRLVCEAVELSELKAAETKLSLTHRIEGALPGVVADERGLRQILANLLSNALKFTPPGGCVTAFAHMAADGRVAFGVEDTGIGIAEEDREQVFERFGRGRHDVTTADRGTGLGLAIVKGFAEAHDGTVDLESELGSGTRVTVYLPKERVLGAGDVRGATAREVA
jgi:two-component system cell cycle sensor histidine kinase PleC